MAGSAQDSWIREKLDDLKSQHLDRRCTEYPEVGGKIRINGTSLINFSSNDYLDLSHHPTVMEAAERALKTYGAGSTASRLVTGTLPLHREVEEKLATHKGYPAALLFGSGYLANLGTITSLVERNDLILADKLSHASLIDAAVQSRARLMRFRHNDVTHLKEQLEKRKNDQRCLVICESVYSMDGDLAPLVEIAGVADQYEAMLMVDEAHATGIAGASGEGRVQEAGLTGQVTIAMGTLSKGMGSYGGYVACSKTVREYLVNRARSFIYTTALPPATLGSILGALKVLEEDPGRGARLLKRAAGFRTQLQAQGLDTMRSDSQIIPVMVGKSEDALAVAATLKQRGILAVAMRPPTVPQNTARLRLSVTLAHSREDLEASARAIGDVVTGLSPG